MCSTLYRLSFRAGLLLVLSCLAPASGVLAQTPAAATNSTGLWLQYTGDHSTGKNFQIHLDTILARGGSSYRPDFIIVRPGLRLTVRGPISTMFAYAYFEAYEARTGTPGKLQEHRISQDLQWVRALHHSSSERPEVTLRFRYEERFRRHEGASSTDWNVAQRTKYLLAGKIPAPWRGGEGGPRYLNVYDEVFIHTVSPRGDFSFDQNQTGVGVGWHLRRDLDIELGYLHTFAADATRDTGAHQHILRLNIVSRLPLLRRH